MSSRFDTIQIRGVYVGALTSIQPNTGDMLVDGSIGLGTYSPSARLDVGGGTGAPAGAQFSAVIRGYSGGARTMYFDGVSNASVWWGSGNTPQFAIDSLSGGGASVWTNVGGSWYERMRYTAGGYIGINTTSPFSRLDIYAGIQSNTATLGNSAIYARGADVGLAIGQDNGAGGYGTWIQSLRTDNATFPLAINPAGGRVAIGGFDPVASLDNQGSFGTYRQRGVTTMVTDSLGAAGTQAKRYEIARASIDYNDWNDTGVIEIELYEKYYSDGLKKRYLVTYGWAAGAGLYMVEMSGYGHNNFQVTIGAPVTISGDIRYLPIYVDVKYYGYVTAVVKTNRFLTTSNSTPGAGYIYFQNNPSGADIADFTPGSTVYTGNIMGANSVFPTGYVGIGTPTPSNKLTLITSSSTYADSLRITDGVGFMNIGHWDGNYNRFEFTGKSTFFVQYGGSESLLFGTQGNERMRIDAAGNIAIGSTNTTQYMSGTERLLNITNSNVASLYLHSTSGRLYSMHSIASGDLVWYDMSAVAERLRLTASGNVGIGTSTPFCALDVVGTGNFTQSLYGGNGDLTWDHSIQTFSAGAASQGSISSDKSMREGVSSVIDGSRITAEWNISNGNSHYNGTIIIKQDATTSVSPGQLLYKTASVNQWALADADALASSNTMLGIALNAGQYGIAILIKGFYNTTYHDQYTSAGAGKPVYVSPTAGNVTEVAPSSSGQTVRVVGYNFYSSGDDTTVYFDPDGTWVTI